jgi:hypothetical protein
MFCSQFILCALNKVLEYMIWFHNRIINFQRIDCNQINDLITILILSFTYSNSHINKSLLHCTFYQEYEQVATLFGSFLVVDKGV